MIVTAATGCDNVEWGGAEVRLQPPPSSTGGADSDSVAGESEAGPRLPEGPVLFMAERGEEGVTLVPVGEIGSDSILPFPTDESASGFRAAFARERFSPGSSFILFSGGTRVGTFRTEEVTTDSSFCAPRPAASGLMEVVPEAAGASRFLALAEADAAGYRHGPYEAPLDDVGRRNASIDLAAEVIRQVEARWPTSLLAARRALRGFSLAPDGPDAFAATFLFRDELAVTPAETASWALFLLGVERDAGYRPAYVWYRPADQEGKGAPRFVERLDWDGDGRTEVLLEVLGEEARWLAALDVGDGGWARVYEDPCGASAAPVQGEGG